jgi:hypothetical protein
MNPPNPGPAYNVTWKLTPNLSIDPTNGRLYGLSPSDYAALQAQVVAGQVSYAWTGLPEYLTPGLYISSPIPLQTFDNTTRPAASVAGVTMIFNSDDGAPNWSNGINWIDSSGNIT